MKVIALRGNPNQGKSSTLNIVYQFMLLFGFTQAPPGPRHFSVLNADQGDFIDILEKKGKKVGIATMGDYGDDSDYSVKNLLAYLDSQGCDIAICACNLTVASTVSAYTYHEFVDKSATTIDALQRINNSEDAEKIYKLL